MPSAGARRIWATGVSVAVAIAILAVAGWLLLANNEPNGPADRGVVIIGSDASAETPAPTGTAADPEPVTVETNPTPEIIAVYLTGAVANPDVYRVPPGHRLSDVLELAGGPTADADLDRINLAAYVADAAHYRIPIVGEVAPPLVTTVVPAAGPTQPAADGAGPMTSCATPVNINTATAECLETLPGIGAVRAESIVRHREETGPFVSADGITAVSGIGHGIFGRIAQLITVGGN